MSDAASVVAAMFPVLATVALAVVLIAATAIAALSCCHCRAALALATTVTVCLATTVAAISTRCHCCVALVLPPLPCYPPHSCCHSVAPNLADVVAPALPLPWPLLTSSPLLMQHINTGFCHGVSTMCPSVT